MLERMRKPNLLLKPQAAQGPWINLRSPQAVAFLRSYTRTWMDGWMAAFLLLRNAELQLMALPTPFE